LVVIKNKILSNVKRRLSAEGASVMLELIASLVKKRPALEKFNVASFGSGLTSVNFKMVANITTKR
jgi:3-hydroxy-3-methylglutaryl CoA synthase